MTWNRRFYFLNDMMEAYRQNPMSYKTKLRSLGFRSMNDVPEDQEQMVLQQVTQGTEGRYDGVQLCTRSIQE